MSKLGPQRNINLLLYLKKLKEKICQFKGKSTRAYLAQIQVNDPPHKQQAAAKFELPPQLPQTVTRSQLESHHIHSKQQPNSS